MKVKTNVKSGFAEGCPCGNPRHQPKSAGSL
jgi:hypothetical protein